MAKLLKKVSNAYWVYYVNEAEAKKFDDSKVGKWMYFFKDNDFAAKICEKAVADGVVAEAMHSNAPDGVCCFYLHFDDKEAHKRRITYFLENGLIRKTKAGKLYNISFKFDDQTRKGEYGDGFVSEIKLANFVNLETGEWIGG